MFDHIYSKWWDLNGKFGLLHKINKTRLKFILSKLSNHFSDLSKINVLDVGCGGGIISVPLSKHVANVTAIDQSKTTIESISLEFANHENLKFHCASLHEYCEHLKCKNLQEKYDAIICLEVIEHVDDLEEFVKNLTECVKNDGIIIISTINRTIKAYLGAIFIAERILKWIDVGVHDYKKFVKPSELNKLLNLNKFAITDLKGISFDILKEEWNLSDNIDINFISACTQSNQSNQKI